MAIVEGKKNSCKGQVYRASVNHYATDKEIVFTVRLRKLKKLSCDGCEFCGWLNEALGEVDADWSIGGICNVEHGKIYTLKVCNERKDWETGIVDDWDLCVVEAGGQS
ncbi:MAG: hypothetical protein J7K15_12135 [Deltaproteobacteria bacterium]|nr:hypothetical protein [Deltaproteobacteria bacterium]